MFKAMKLFVSSIISVTVLSISVCGQSNKQNGDGAAIFQEQCSGCHGADGRAQTDLGKKMGAADLTSSEVQQQGDSKLSQTVKDGKKKMPSFDGKLSSDEIHAVIGYIRGLNKD